MSILKAALPGLALLVVAAAVIAHAFYRLDMRQTRNAWAAVSGSGGATGVFDPAMIADLPEPARRYLAYSIAPGTPLRTTVVLRMEGTFALGDRESHRVMPMTANQVLSPPDGFVWMPAGIALRHGTGGLVAFRIESGFLTQSSRSRLASRSTATRPRQGHSAIGC